MDELNGVHMELLHEHIICIITHPIEKIQYMRYMYMYTQWSHIIHVGKTNANHPRGYSFPTEFCIRQNTKLWSNEEETLNLIEKIIKP